MAGMSRHWLCSHVVSSYCISSLDAHGNKNAVALPKQYIHAYANQLIVQYSKKTIVAAVTDAYKIRRASLQHPLESDQIMSEKKMKKLYEIMAELSASLDPAASSLESQGPF